MRNSILYLLLLTAPFLWTTLATGQENALKIHVPEGYAIVGIPQDDHQPMLFGGPVDAAVRCICNEGRGCHPWVYDDGKNIQEGCIMIGCSSCSQQIIVWQNEDSILLNDATIVHLKAGVQFVSSIDEMPSQPVTPAMLQLDTVIQALRNLYAPFSWLPDSALFLSSRNDPLVWGLVVINLFGKWAVIPYPIDEIKKPYLALKAMGASGEEGCQCACYDDNGTGCAGNCNTIPIPFGPDIYYCDASGCLDCSLSMEHIEAIHSDQYETQIRLIRMSQVGERTYDLTVEITSNTAGTATLAVASLRHYPILAYLHQEEIRLKPNKPLTKTLRIQQPEGPPAPFAVIVSDGIGKIYATKLILGIQ